MLVTLTMAGQSGLFCPPVCCPFLLARCHIQPLQGSGHGGQRSCEERKGSTCLIWLWTFSAEWRTTLGGFISWGVSKYVPLERAMASPSATGLSGVCFSVASQDLWVFLGGPLPPPSLVGLLKLKVVSFSISGASTQLPLNWSARTA